MKIEQIKCPACGAALDVPEGRDKMFCQYCGTAIYIDDGIERKEVVHRTIDEAEIVKSNNEVELKKIEFEQYKQYSSDMNSTFAKVMGGFAVIGLIVLILYLFFGR